jgi:hypothetical protein
VAVIGKHVTIYLSVARLVHVAAQRDDAASNNATVLHGDITSYGYNGTIYFTGHSNVATEVQHITTNERVFLYQHGIG